MNFPFFSSKNTLGIDIGTFSIKIVELSKKGERVKLENYGEVTTQQIGNQPFRTGTKSDRSSFSLSAKEIALGIQAILAESKIHTRSVTFSIPDFSTFFTSFELPTMTKEELPKAINFEARQHIPVSLSEVVLDWQVIENNNQDPQKSYSKIILVAVPKEVISQYQEIGRVCKLNIQALEAEVFGLTRSLIKDNGIATIIVDIGAQSTTINIIENKILRASHSFDIAGNDLTKDIAGKSKIDFWEAEELKKKQAIPSGVASGQNDQQFSEIIKSRLDLILAEIEKISQDFYNREGKETPKIVLAGSTALLTGLKEYFAVKLNKEVVIGDPFAGIFYPQILSSALKEIGPSYAVAVGMAERGIE